jgi:hypothetical protein
MPKNPSALTNSPREARYLYTTGDSELAKDE